SQLEIARQQGAAAMLLASAAPANLAQSGGVRLPELGLAPLPALSIGAGDAQAIRNAIAAGQTVRATLSVDASLERHEGRNVVGWRRRPNSQPGDPYLLFGAHYDTWSVGSTDNGTGVATMLEIADSLNVNGGPPRDYDLAFVGYDAEELGLLGGYDFMRKHLVAAADPVSAFLHVDMTGIAKPEYMGNLLPRFFAFSGGGPLAGIADEVGVSSLYQNVLGMEMVPAITGGLIPTDVQGLYWGGLDGAIALSYTPFYHTAADTPDTVDLPFLTTNTLAIKAFLDRLDEEPPASFAPKDPGLLYADVTANYAGPTDLFVTVQVKDAAGQPVVRPWVQLRLYVDDFTVPGGGEAPNGDGPRQEIIGNDLGEATFVVAPEFFYAGDGVGGRWLHVRVGKETERFPRGEHVKPLP
ncbi:MAG TPA: M28 family peptidase, partial [Polyangiaceae bacterium]|nr:M28 family peptidase [Polyangiaceae bacterium]